MSEEDHKENLRKNLKTKSVVIYVEKPGPRACPMCKRNADGNWRFQKGKWRQPIPENKRRTKEKEESPAFSGYCTDPTTGFYIGGIGNDCRFGGTKKRCEVHKPVVKKKTKKQVTKKRNADEKQD